MTAKPSYEELERRIQELEKAESELSLAKDRFKKIFDNAQDAIFIHDLEGKILDVNDKMCRMYGLTKEEALEVTIEDVSSSKMSMEILLERWQKVLNDEKLFFEWEALKPKDKSVFNVEVSIQKISFHDKDIVLANVRDITERRLMENENLALANIIKRSQDFIGVADMRGNPFFVNPAGQTLVGLNGDEAVKCTTIKDYFTEEDLPFFEETILPTLVAEGRWQGEYRFRHFKTGAPIPLLYDLFLTENPETGQITNISTISRDITERKQAEEQLRKSEEQFRNLYDEAPVGYFEYDLQGNITRVNHTYSKMLGYITEEMIGQPCWEFIVDEVAREQIMAKLDEVRPPAVGLERTYRRKDGSTFAVLFEDRLLLDEEGHIKGIRTAIQDITELKRAEEALVESEALFRGMFKDHSAVMLLIDPNTGQIVKANQAAAHYYGYSLEKMLQMNIQQLNILSPSEVTEEMGSALNKQINIFKFQHKLADGRIRDVEVHSAPITIQHQTLLFSIIRDITEREQAELTIKESEERFRNLMENIDAVAVQGYGPDGTTHYWNKAAERLYGYSQQEAIGCNLLDLIIPSEMKGDVAKAILEMAESGKPIPSGELLLMHKDGSRVPVLSHHAIIKVPGREQELFCFDVDITYRKQAEVEREKLQAQLNQAQKMESVGRLAGGVAHDFNNMLSVILGHTEMALEVTDPASPLYADLHSVHQAGERSAALTRQLLAFARKQTVAPKVIDINDTVKGMLNMLRRLIGEDIDLLWQPGSNLRPVKVDPAQIDQLLANLCVNARDAITGVGKITIATDTIIFDEDYCTDHLESVPGEYVLLEVSDDGCGMDKKTLSRIFEPFFTTKEKGKGTGLGLASVFGMVKQNNGYINVYSEPEQGTTFKIYLPVYAVKSDKVVEKPPGLPAEHGNETILLVEDETAILEMTTRMLERLGYTVMAAATPGEAIRLAHEYQGRIDLLMTDVVMPEMNGRELAGNLLSHYPDLRRLFMSGYTANVIAHHGVLDEGTHFIQKPFSMKDLGGKLREALEG